MKRRLLLSTILMTGLISAAVIDRIALVVEAKVIKDSDINREIRITDFINGEKLDFTPDARKKAANRLIDQSIIRHEIELGRYQEASDDEINKLLADTLRTHPSPASYGITEAEVRKALKWQITVLRFIDIRFKPQQANTPGSDPFITWLDGARKSTNIKFKEEEIQ